MIKAVFFDWSGTLCDDQTNVSTSIGKLSIPPHLFRSLPYTRVFSFLRYIVTIFPLNTKFFYLKISHPANINYSLFPQTKKILQFLKDKKIHIGIISLQSSIIIRKELENTGIAQYIDILEGGMHHKGALISRHIKQLHLAKHEALFITDLANDIKEVHGRSIIGAAMWGYNTKENLIKSKPDFFLKDLNELKIFIDLKNNLMPPKLAKSRNS